jgi:hypothetical protein
MSDAQALLTAIQSDLLKAVLAEINEIVRAAVEPLHAQAQADPIAVETVKPFGMKPKQASAYLGGKAVSEIYDAAGRGDLDLVKDGASTLVTFASLERYAASLPKAKIKERPPRKPSAIVPPLRIAKHHK